MPVIIRVLFIVSSRGIDHKIKSRIIYYKVYGEIETKKIINSKEKKAMINRAGDNALRKINKHRDFGEIIESSKQFALESGLLKSKRLIKKIKEIEKNNGKASMIMLGESIFSTKPFKGCKIARIKTKKVELL